LFPFEDSGAALELDGKAVRRYALQFSWAATTEQFADAPAPAEGSGTILPAA